MRITLALIALLAFCSPPPKTYDKPEIGIPYIDFVNLCGLYFDNFHSLENGQGKVVTYTYKTTDVMGHERAPECVGIFTFTNDKLTSIEH